MTGLELKNPVTVVILYVEGDTPDVQEIKVSVSEIENALLSKGHRVKVVEVNRNNWWRAIRTSGDVYFNLVEDLTWELYQKVAFGLEELGKAQVGHSKKMLTFAIDKKIMKRKLKQAKLNTPKYRIFSCGEHYLRHIRKLEYPLIVKPAGQHAGVGISQDSVVLDEKQADERITYLYSNYDGEVLVEEFIQGREITVTVIGNGKHAIVLPMAELVFSGKYKDNWPIYSYNAKWTENSWEYTDVVVDCPAGLGTEMEAQVDSLAKTAFAKLSLVDVVRMDIRIDDKTGKAYIVDINGSPSMSADPQEGTTRAARALGWSYEDMMETIVAVAYRRVFGKGVSGDEVGKTWQWQF